MQYFDIQYLGYGVGIVVAFLFFGLVLSVVLNLFKKIGLMMIFFAVYMACFNCGSVSAVDFIQLPPGLDWSSAFADLVALFSPLVLLAVGFGAFTVIKKILNKVGTH